MINIELPWNPAVLEQRVGRLAAWLLDQGVDPGDRVGLLLANEAMKYTTKAMNVNGFWNASQVNQPPDCASPISTRLTDPTHSTGTSRAMPIGISYETIWHASRMAP